MIRCLDTALTRLTKAEKLEEIKIVRCLEVALYQSRESRAKKKRFIEDSYLTLCVHLNRLRLSPSLYHFVYFEIKLKKAYYIFIHQRCYCFSLYTILLNRVIFSDTTKQVFMSKLNVLYVKHLKDAHERKFIKYLELAEQYRSSEYQT